MCSAIFKGRADRSAARSRRRRGYSLVELLVVCAIILLMISMILAVIAGAYKAAMNLKQMTGH